MASNTLVEGPTLAPIPRLDRQGVWTQLAVLVWRTYLEVSARYDWLDARHNPTAQFQAVTAGLTIYAYHTNVKLQALYTRRFLRTEVTPDENLFLLFATLGR